MENGGQGPEAFTRVWHSLIKKEKSISRGVRKFAARMVQATSLAILLPLAAASLVTSLLYNRYRLDTETLLNEYRIEKDSQARVQALQIQGIFSQIHRGLQTISELPAIRNAAANDHPIDQPENHWDSDAYFTTKQIFGRLYKDYRIGRIAVSTKTQLQQKTWSPTLYFDASTTRFAELRPPTPPVNEPNLVSEAANIRRQFEEFERRIPDSGKVERLNLPALLTDPILEEGSAPSYNRSVFVFSVPVYGPGGLLQGIVSCTFPTTAIRSRLIDNTHALVDESRDIAIRSSLHEIDGDSTTDLSFLKSPLYKQYSSTYHLDFPDMNGRWTLRTTASYDAFWHRKDVLVLKRTFVTGVFVVWLGALALILSIRSIRRRQDRQLEGFLRGSQELLFLIDNKGRVLHAGGQIKIALGWETSDLLGRKLSNFIPTNHRDDFQRHIDEAADIAATGEFLFEAKDQSFSWYEFTSTKMPDGQQNSGILVSLRNVEARKNAEFMLRSAKEAAENANLAKSEFLSRMSHELRTPLNAILGFGQLLEMSPIRKQDQESVGQILRAGRHLLNIVNDILDISKIESGNFSLSVEPVDCQEAVETVLSFVGPLARQNGISIKFEVEPNTSVMADRQRLVQILVNLCTNAIKYNRENGTVLVKAWHDQDDQVSITVSDTGIGISPSAIDRLFTPFDRLGAERLTIEGSGLGLALAKNLVEAMKGAISVDSQVGVGTTMTVQMPHAQPQLKVVPGGQIVHIVPSGNTKVNILSIEDNLANQQLITEMLADYPQYTLHHTTHGSIGLERLETLRPKIVLLDLHLADMSGLQVLEQIRQSPFAEGSKIIVLSAETNPETLERALFMGADHIHSKPIDIHELLTLLNTISEAA